MRRRNRFRWFRSSFGVPVGGDATIRAQLGVGCLAQVVQQCSAHNKRTVLTGELMVFAQRCSRVSGKPGVNIDGAFGVP